MNFGYFLAAVSLFAAVIGIADDEDIGVPVCGVVFFSFVGYLWSKL